MDNDDRDDDHGNPQERRDHHLPRTRCSPRGKIVAAQNEGELSQKTNDDDDDDDDQQYLILCGRV